MDTRSITFRTRETVSFPGFEASFTVAAEQTSGAFSMAEFVVRPGAFVPPHVHERTDEVSYVVEGELGFMLDGEDVRAAAGATVVRPRGIPHALWNASGAPARMVEVYAPGGFERWFVELARLFAAEEPPSLRELDEAGRRHDTILVPELVPRLVEAHGLELPPLR